MIRVLFLSIFGIMLCAASALAQSSLRIHQKSGGIVSYSFSEKPRISYTSDGLHLVTSSVTVDYPLANLEKLTFEESSTDISAVYTEGVTADIQIFTASGTLVQTIRPEEKSATFSIDNLPAGTYVIKNGTTTYKIMKK